MHAKGGYDERGPVTAEMKKKNAAFTRQRAEFWKCRTSCEDDEKICRGTLSAYKCQDRRNHCQEACQRLSPN
jgi:hypothetical protein